ANATFSNGVGTFLVTLKTVAGGPWTVTAQDTATATFTGTSGSITVTAGAASYFTVVVPAVPVGTGTAFSVTVMANDAAGNIATGYTGHVHFTSSDAAASLPSDS